MQLDPAAAELALARLGWRARPDSASGAALAVVRDDRREHGQRDPADRASSAASIRASWRWSRSAAPARCTRAPSPALLGMRTVLVPPQPGPLLGVRRRDRRRAGRSGADLLHALRSGRRRRRSRRRAAELAEQARDALAPHGGRRPRGHDPPRRRDALRGPELRARGGPAGRALDERGFAALLAALRGGAPAPVRLRAARRGGRDHQPAGRPASAPRRPRPSASRGDQQAPSATRARSAFDGDGPDRVSRTSARALARRRAARRPADRRGDRLDDADPARRQSRACSQSGVLGLRSEARDERAR